MTARVEQSPARRRLALTKDDAITKDPCALYGQRCDPTGFDLVLIEEVADVCRLTGALARDVCSWANSPALQQLRHGLAGGSGALDTTASSAMRGSTGTNRGPSRTDTAARPSGKAASRSVRLKVTMIAELEEEVRHRQQARLEKAAVGALPRGRPSRWAHVPLGALLEEAGNTIFEAGGGELESGHRPYHTSRSGRCLRLSPRLGLWFCRGCRQGGDALTFWIVHTGLSRRKAAEQLAARYGAPKATRRGKAIVLEAVVP